MARWHAPGGVDIERIVLDDRECFRMRHRRFLVGYCYTLHELKTHLQEYGLTWADLEPIDDGYVSEKRHQMLVGRAPVHRS